MPLAEKGVEDPQNDVGCIMFGKEDFHNAKPWFEAAFLRGQTLAAYNTLVTNNRLQNIPEANFWFNVVSKPDMMPDEPEKRKHVEEMGRGLRELKNRCGGCDAALAGERRQYCKQCKTYCYCSRECQKLHWNRPGGHRSECMGVQRIKEKMRTNCRAAGSSGNCR